MIIEQLRNLLILVVLIVIGVVINIVLKSNNPICPDDFKNPKQEIASFEKWVNDFMIRILVLLLQKCLKQG